MYIEMIPYLLLLLAIIAGWLINTRLAMLVFGISVVVGIVLGRLTPLALIWIGILGLTIWLPTRFQFQILARLFCYGVFLLLGVAMLGNLVPGFNNLPVYQDIQFSPDSFPFMMYLNFDQPVVGLFLLLFFLKPNQSPNFGMKSLLVSLKTLGLLSALMFTIALAIEYVRYDLKFPELGWLWILNNLFFVCLAEEALFRGFIQKTLSEMLPKTKPYAVISILLAAALFGLAHYKGGGPLIALATVAGCFFGYAYHRTNRIESPVFVHFGLNLIHFIFFSYPALMR